MSFLGRLLYRYRNGIRPVYYRERVRPRILKTEPITGLNDKSAEVHLLTSHDDWLNALWALKSFFLHTKARYGVCLHDDGTLEDEAAEQLLHHFPEARLIRRAESDTRAEQQLHVYTACRALRMRHPLALKVMDFFLYLEGPKLIVLDSDVLFFSRPEGLLTAIAREERGFCTFNRDVATAYTCEPKQLETALGFPIMERVNSGLGVLPREAFDPGLLERALKLPELDGHFWRVEQTLFAILCSRQQYEHLPPEYDVSLEPRLNPKAPVRHYVGAIRHLMYSQGLCRLARRGMLNPNPSRGAH